MSRPRPDWVDRLARRAAGHAATADTSASGDAERLSRATAVRLALAGVASLSLGVARTRPAQAAEWCFTDCLQSYDAQLERRLTSCDDVFRRTSVWGADWNGLFHYLSIALNLGRAYVANQLLQHCYADAQAELDRWRNDCYRRCEEGCRHPSGRSLQGVTGPRQTCKAPPPPEEEPPEVPPAPQPDEDPCWSCAAVGGVVCGVCSDGVTCSCATPCEGEGCPPEGNFGCSPC